MPIQAKRNTAVGAVLLALVISPQLVTSQRSIPSGTILPVELRSSLSSEKSRAGQTITAKVMQDVPLPAGKRIRAGSKVIGYVESTKPATTGHPGELTIKFARVESKHESLPISANLRALASVMEVESAQIPTTGPDRGTPYAWATRALVGGQVAYGDGGPVANGTHIVGRVSVGGGVLAPIPANSSDGIPEANGRLRFGLWSSYFSDVSSCPGDVIDNTLPQAFWVFSSDACGVFGSHNLYIAHVGTTEPVGYITVAAKHGKVKIGSGSGMLLRINGNSR
jgi:hypothetical protein